MPLQTDCVTTLTFTNPNICCHLICADAQPIHITFSTLRHQKALLQLQKIIPGLHFEQNLAPHPFLKNLEYYFSGRIRTLPVEPASCPFIKNDTNFRQKVWELIGKIPYGETRSYGEIAEELGGRNYARAVGQACNHNPLVLAIPCHRVIAASGSGGFAGGKTVKEYLLQMEKTMLTETS